MKTKPFVTSLLLFFIVIAGPSLANPLKLLVQVEHDSYDWNVDPIYIRDEITNVGACGCGYSRYGSFDMTWGPLSQPVSGYVTVRQQNACSREGGTIHYYLSASPDDPGTEVFATTAEGHCHFVEGKVINLARYLPEDSDYFFRVRNDSQCIHKIKLTPARFPIRNVIINPVSETAHNPETIQFSHSLGKEYNEPCYNWEVAGRMGSTVGYIAGKVSDLVSYEPIYLAEISTNGGGRAYSDSAGEYALLHILGTWTMNVYASGYALFSDRVVVGGGVTIKNISMVPIAISTSTTTDSITTTTVDSTTTTVDSTTTTANSTTTITICPLKEIFGQHSEETELLRYFRDQVLNKTPGGKEVIRLYYDWSPVIVKAMEMDEEFKEGLKAVIDGILPLILEEPE